MSKRIIYTVWVVWEFLFRLFGRVRPLKRNERHLFYIAKRRYLGKPFDVDGVHVDRFDLVVELHMNNYLLMDVLREQTSLVGLAVKLVQEAKKSLPVLAESLRNQKFNQAQVLYGITFIHRGVERFGFQILPLRRHFIRSVTTWHLKHIFRIVNPNAEAMLSKHPDVFEPMIVAMSKEHLFSNYGPGQSPTSSTMSRRDHVLT
ncbi:polysaccharide deacetylase [Alicyclobacillus tolerans]|uniref:YkoP family protein n=1 Tax=Alicyclobacillus tolerans TaxID=90970 RepID=UPI001F3F5519|nr:polysaccharide deacetylase [Alicyclobacillus tolerans]MCF8563434.1 polysaccharide deacetylase [Alicyclobacillus tolerans]